MTAQSIAVRGFVMLALVGVVIPLHAFQFIDGSDPGEPRGVDFRTFHESARSFRATGQLYPEPRSSEMPNLNNPHTTAALYAPLAELPYGRAFILYSVVSFALMLGALPILSATVEAEGFAALAVALALLAWFPTYLSAEMAQVGVVLVLPLAVSWWALARGREGLAGSLTACRVSRDPLRTEAERRPSFGILGRIWAWWFHG